MTYSTVSLLILYVNQLLKYIVFYSVDVMLVCFLFFADQLHQPVFANLTEDD